MIINGQDITKLTIEQLRELETVLVEQILVHYDCLDSYFNSTDAVNSDINVVNNWIDRDLTKLQTVRVEIQYRFQTELLNELPNISRAIKYQGFRGV